MVTYARSGGIFNNHFIANLPRNFLVKNFVKRLRFDRIMAPSLWPDFFGALCTSIAQSRARARYTSLWPHCFGPLCSSIAQSRTRARYTSLSLSTNNPSSSCITHAFSGCRTELKTQDRKMNDQANSDLSVFLLLVFLFNVTRYLQNIVHCGSHINASATMSLSHRMW